MGSNLVTTTKGKSSPKVFGPKHTAYITPDTPGKVLEQRVKSVLEGGLLQNGATENTN